MADSFPPSTIKYLQKTLKDIYQDPVEGVFVEPNGDLMNEWNIYMEGPSGSPYAGGVFKLLMKFPPDYPMSPPSLEFLSKFWHPNVYKNGRVCISILHPPGVDEMSGELPEERWMPTQSVDKIMLSVISLLSDPNTFSPANVDASVEWRNQREKYVKRVKELCEASNKDLPKDLKIPHPDSNADEHAAQVERIRAAENPQSGFDDYEDFMYDSGGDDFDDDDGDACCSDDALSD